MGLFGRKDGSTSASASSLQIPDELAQRAHLEYGNARFVEAAELYSEAVDKLHTMYVVANCQVRGPSAADSGITEGLAQSVGAALSMDPGAPVRQLVEKSTAYLTEIAQLEQAIEVASLYTTAIAEMDREVRSAGSR